ncbi:MAG: hypothetical protein ACMXYF_02495 [Candidatus Woesearchaeota archaeon]
MNQLEEYILQNLSRGYDARMISQTLLSSGYTQDQINQAFQTVYQMQNQGFADQSGGGTQKKPVSLLLVVIVIVAILFVATLASLILFSSSNGDQPPRGDDRPIIDPRPSEPTTSPSQPNQRQPDPGNDSNSQPSQPTPPEQPSTPTTPPSQPADTTNLRTSSEILAAVQDIVQFDPDEAAKLCVRINIARTRSQCVTDVAIEAEDHRYCDVITHVPDRDDCYLQFVIQGKATDQTCANIVDASKQARCEQVYTAYRRISEFRLPETPQPPENDSTSPSYDSQEFSFSNDSQAQDEQPVNQTRTSEGTE